MSRRKKKPTDLSIYEASIESLSHDGRGIAHINGKTIFIEQALPHERIRFQLTNKHGTYDEGKTIEILQASPFRKQPPCPYHAVCGGCSLQHVDPNEQLKHKESVLLDQLKHFGQVLPETVHTPITSPSLGYRNKARLGLRYVAKKDKLLIGFREKNGRYITDIQQCLVLHPSMGLKINSLQQLLNAFEHKRSIPQIEVAVGDKETALVIRHLEPLSPIETQALIQFAETEKLSIYLQPEKMSSIYKLFPVDSPDDIYYILPDDSLTLFFHPCDFTQINPSVNISMVRQAKAWLALQSHDRLLDLFCGVGNFSLPLSKHCQSVTGIEGDPMMVEKAKKNAAWNQRSSVEFFQSNLADSVTSQPWFHRSYSKLLLDPPRSGALEILKQLAKHPFDRIVYISCNPATLARDAAELVHQQHYRLVQVNVMDMFPHTTHVESMGLFLKEDL